MASGFAGVRAEIFVGHTDRWPLRLVALGGGGEPAHVGASLVIGDLARRGRFAWGGYCRSMTSSAAGAGRDSARWRRGAGGRTARDVRRRVYSQNFLRDGGAAQHFLRQVDLDPRQLCLEIGAGDGALTEQLSLMCDHLVA
ncbi:unnamed protein product, partial [marine sediment metagenome]